MTCKDCIHSGLCYKENDYDNFPDRCGDFISNKVLEERAKGKWIIVKDEKWGDNVKCPFCGKELAGTDLNFCCKCGADMTTLEDKGD